MGRWFESTQAHALNFIKMSIEEIVKLAVKWHRNEENTLYTEPESMAEIIDMVESGQVSHANARVLFQEIERKRKERARECYEYLMKIVTVEQLEDILNK